MPNSTSSGSSSPGEDETKLSGARAEFVGSLPRRLDALRAALRSAEQLPSDAERANGLLRRIHAVGAAARVLGFASVAEALGEAEKNVKKATEAGRPAPLNEVARALDILPSLVLGAPLSMRAPESRERPPEHVWPISVLVYGAAALADALGDHDTDTRIERERTEDPARARELARIVGPDVVVVDADRPGSRELVAELARDPLVEPVPIIVAGTFDHPEAASAFVELGAARVLLKPCTPDTLRRTVHELRDRASKPHKPRDPLGSVTVPALAERIANEFKRGLVDALEGSRATEVALGEGHDVLAAVWGAVARVRELVTLRSSGGLRFQPTGPEGAVPLAPWSAEERRAGERGPREGRSGEGVSLNGRRIVVADDDPAVVWFMAGLLKAVGAEVIEAHDGKQALELTYSRYPDTVISDVLMPKLDGFSLCHEIKRDVAVRDVPVILLSWKEDLLQRLRELGADADGYLRKEAAASAVVERVREVLQSRGRIEERMRAGGEVRGRLDGLTPRLVLALACRAESDVRVSLRDAAFLYEIQIRRGMLRSVTRSSPDGSFVRGEGVLSSLLGVSAGRFVVEPDSSSCRAELSGSLDELLARPIALARSALAKVAERSLVRVESLELDRELVEAYLACTPEPAATLTRRLLAGESAKALVLSGEVAPRLLEAVLSDIARRGGVKNALLGPGLSLPPREAVLTEGEVRSAPPPAVSAKVDTLNPSTEPSEPAPDSDAPPVPQAAPAVDRDDAGWFSLAVEPSAEPPRVDDPAAVVPGASEAGGFEPAEPTLSVAGNDPRLPLNDQATPGDWQAGPLFAFGGEHKTLPGVGELPRVAERESKTAAAQGPDAAPAPEHLDSDPAPQQDPEHVPTDPAPAPKSAAGPDSEEVPTLELASAVLDSDDDDDDDDRATFPIPERSPVPASPVPEKAVVDERSAPTQPPSRVARKLAAASKPDAPAATATGAEKKGKESVVGLVLKGAIAMPLAFVATTWLVQRVSPTADSPAPEGTEAVAEALQPPPPAPAASSAPLGFSLRSEPVELHDGSLDPAQGLVEIELGEPGSIKVDDSFHGRFDKRRVLLPPGKHRIDIESERGTATLEVDVVAGRAVRVVPEGVSPASPAGSAPSTE